MKRRNNKKNNNNNNNATIIIDDDDDDDDYDDAISVRNLRSTSPLLKKNPFNYYSLIEQQQQLPSTPTNELEVMVSDNSSHVKQKTKVNTEIQNGTIVILSDDDGDDDDDINNVNNYKGYKNINKNKELQTVSSKSSPNINKSLEKLSLENKQTKTKKKSRKKNFCTESFIALDNEQIPDSTNKNSQKKLNKEKDKTIEIVDDEIEVVWCNSPDDKYEKKSNDSLFFYDLVGTPSNLAVLNSSTNIPIVESNSKVSTKSVNPSSTNESVYYFNSVPQPPVKKTRNTKAPIEKTNYYLNNLNPSVKSPVTKARKTRASTAAADLTANQLNEQIKPPVKKKKKIRKLKNKKKRKRLPSETYVYDSSDEIEETKQNENLNTEELTNNKQINEKLRTIVVDGSNVAMSHSNHTTFSIKGIELVINYFTSRGHKVKVFLSKNRDQGKDKIILDKWYRNGIVVFTPSRKVDTKRITPYDDRFILDYALECDGIVVSNDQFRDLYEESTKWHKIIKTRLLQPTFVDDYVMFPQDPLGITGPSLDKFLRH